MSYESWIGYLEHQTPDRLGEFRANVGKGGCTIFAQMVLDRTGVNLMGLSWCTTFVFAVHEKARRLGRPCCGVNTLARRMILRRRWRPRSYRPKSGDLIFLHNRPGELIGHVGIVTVADLSTVTSIEGNAVDPSGVFPPEQGGAVAIRTRRLDDPKIVGYASIGNILERR